MTDDKKNLEEAIAGIFRTSVSGSGEEEMLRIASTYSLQISAPQMRLLIYLVVRSYDLGDVEKEKLQTFIKKWLELKSYNSSAAFVMRALESISLRKFINENTMKVNVQK